MQKIEGTLHNFLWGDTFAIANVRGMAPSGRPEAEYWLGTHPKGPGRICSPDSPRSTVDLADYIANEKDEALGPSTTDRFGRLPYLLKLLAAAQPLSIQVHPNQEQAGEGFRREDGLGIDRLAPNRNYRDPSHKPELICALTRFEAKCGFRVLPATKRLLALFDDVRTSPLKARLNPGGGGAIGSADRDDESKTLADTVQWLLRLDDGEAKEITAGLVDEAKRLSDPKSGNIHRPEVQEFAPELRWTVDLNETFPGDPGVAVALLLNHVVLEPGQAMFLKAGMLHSYLRGFAVELMANSDNVLRGGLTHKHVDVDELLRVVSTEPCEPRVQRPQSAVHRYDVPVPEFGLRRYAAFAGGGPDPAAERTKAHHCVVVGPEILLVTSGEAELSSSSGQMTLTSGEAAFVPFVEGRFELRLTEPETMVWRASVGDLDSATKSR